MNAAAILLIAIELGVQPMAVPQPKPEPKPEPVVASAPLCDAACVECESGWDVDAYNAAGPYWGLYQYNQESWISDGGSPESWGNASAEEQHRVASNATFDRWPNC